MQMTEQAEPRPVVAPSVRLAWMGGRPVTADLSFGPQPEQRWQVRERLRAMTDEQLDELSTGLHSMSDEELAVRLEQA